MEAFQWVEGEIQVPEGKILVAAMFNGDGIATILDAGAELTDGLHWEDENGFAVVVPSIKELTNIEYMTPSEARAASERRQNEAIARRYLGRPSHDTEAVIAGLAGALEACMEQISQMRGMFDDEDGAIQRAIESGEEALQMQQAVIQSPQKLVVVIEGGMVREVLSAQGGFSVAVIDYDKNADLDDMIVIPQGDGEKNAYALAAIHEPEVTPAARVDELYSAVVEAKPAAEDEDSPRMRC